MRQALIKLVYDNVNISEDVSRYLVGFSYSDEAHGKQDNISVTLADPDGRWRAAWRPRKGAALKAGIRLQNWKNPGDRLERDFGVFEIDEITLRGKPNTVEIKAVAVPVQGSLRNSRKTRAWENVTLETILAQLAEENGMEAMYDSGGRGVKKRIDQRGETDAQFLSRLAEENGLCFKAAKGRLIFYDSMEYEAKAAVCTLDLDSDLVTGFSLTDKTDDIYTSCTVTYWDAATEQNLTCTYDPWAKAVKTAGSKVALPPDDGGTYRD